MASGQERFFASPKTDKNLEFAQRWRNSQPVNNPMLQQGDRGVAVVGLQTLLNRFSAGLVVDGIFGAATRAAVIAFQTNNELRPDGIVDAKTWMILRFAPLRLVDLKTRYNPQRNPHQIHALNWLQTQIPIATLNEFAHQWRNLA